MNLQEYVSYCKVETKTDKNKFARIGIYSKDIHGGLNTEDKDVYYSLVNKQWVELTIVAQYIQPDRGPNIEKIISRNNRILTDEQMYGELLANAYLLIQFLKEFDLSTRLMTEHF